MSRAANGSSSNKIFGFPINDKEISDKEAEEALEELNRKVVRMREAEAVSRRQIRRAEQEEMRSEEMEMTRRAEHEEMRRRIELELMRRTEQEQRKYEGQTKEI